MTEAVAAASEPFWAWGCYRSFQGVKMASVTKMAYLRGKTCRRPSSWRIRTAIRTTLISPTSFDNTQDAGTSKRYSMEEAVK